MEDVPLQEGVHKTAWMGIFQIEFDAAQGKWSLEKCLQPPRVVGDEECNSQLPVKVQL